MTLRNFFQNTDQICIIKKPLKIDHHSHLLRSSEDSICQDIMNNKQHNDIELRIFEKIPKEELEDFIEKNGARLREILGSLPDETDEQVINNLIE